MSVVKLKDIDRAYIIEYTPERILSSQGVNVLHGAIDYLENSNLRFNTKTGKVYDKTGVRSAIRNYKNNPYHDKNIKDILLNELMPWIGDAVSYYRRNGEFE